MENNDELKSFPSLNKMSRKEPFEAPSGYFDQLSSNIQDRINKEKTISIAPSFRLRPITIIASLVIFLLISGIYLYINQNKNDKQEIAVTYDELLESGYYKEFDEATLCEYIPAAVNDSISNKDEKNIDDYLINNADESLISNSF